MNKVNKKLENYTKPADRFTIFIKEAIRNNLLIDKDIASLGHRKILLGKYTSAGVSIQPHTDYRFNTVLDFYY